jgi:hypothetical protein
MAIVGLPLMVSCWIMPPDAFVFQSLNRVAHGRVKGKLQKLPSLSFD